MTISRRRSPSEPAPRAVVSIDRHGGSSHITIDLDHLPSFASAHPLL
jgi:hypothetical protein